jgi:hypothetical protein
MVREIEKASLGYDKKGSLELAPHMIIISQQRNPAQMLWVS